jgi:aspartate oxidase
LPLGEVSCTGVHGANRWRQHLLEGLFRIQGRISAAAHQTADKIDSCLSLDHVTLQRRKIEEIRSLVRRCCGEEGIISAKNLIMKLCKAVRFFAVKSRDLMKEALWSFQICYSTMLLTCAALKRKAVSEIITV